MFGRQRPEVLVTGAGPVGQFAALLLARRDVRVQIVDEEWRRAAHSYALALHPGTLELLDQVGLLDPVVEAAYPVHSVGLYEGSERRAELRLSDLDSEHPYLAVIEQDVLEHRLEEALEQHGVEILWNHRVSRFSQDVDRITVTVDRLVKESVGYAVAHTEWMVGRSKDVEVPLLIGADGHRSLIRRQLEIDFDQVGPPLLFAVFEFKTDADLAHEMRVIMNEGDTDVLWPLADGYCRFSFELEGAEVPESTRLKDRLVVQLGTSRFPALDEGELEAQLRQRAPWFEGSIDEVRWRMAVRFESRLASAFGSHRIWLAGDAGHMTGPVGIQSMNVGLREAAELSAIAGRVLDGGAGLDQLEAYGLGRQREWRFLLGLSGGLRPRPDTDPWIERRLTRLLPCLPASGQHLESLAGQLRLEVEKLEVPLAIR